jgi:glycopeptide antibiotics resistance protein
VALVTVAALAAAPVSAGFTLKALSCDFGPSPDWLATIVNVRHLVSFGVLATLAFIVFRDQPVWVPILFMVAVTVGVEIEQGIFASGHCRARDLIPDALAIVIGWALAKVTPRRWLGSSNT